MVRKVTIPAHRESVVARSLHCLPALFVGFALGLLLGVLL